MAEIARSAAYRRGVIGRTFGHLLDSERVFGYALVAPAVIYIVALVAYPFGIALWFTVTNATVGDPLGKFTGLANLQAVLDDDIFRRAVPHALSEDHGADHRADPVHRAPLLPRLHLHRHDRRLAAHAGQSGQRDARARVLRVPAGRRGRRPRPRRDDLVVPLPGASH